MLLRTDRRRPVRQFLIIGKKSLKVAEQQNHSQERKIKGNKISRRLRRKHRQKPARRGCQERTLYRLDDQLPAPIVGGKGLEKESLAKSLGGECNVSSVLGGARNPKGRAF